MENRIDILNELKELSPVIAGMGKVNVFIVPAGYFESLSGDILASLNEEGSSLINGLPDQSSLEVPQGYFESLADTILSRIKTQNAENASDELRTLSPMLYSIQGENIFEVPQGYFAGLSEHILVKVQPQQPKVILMRRRSSSFIKYAVAAAFTGVMALGVFKFTNNSKDNTDPVIAQGIQIAKENKFDEELAKITDADILSYLETNGSDVKAAIVANSVDENELPSQTDYLMDEKALDKYLDNININGLKN